MTESETRAIVTISLLAAFADGHKHERERAEVRRIADALARDDAVHLPTLVQDVLLRRVSLADAAPALQGTAARQLAYEMAVGVCDADGAQSPAEQAFLAELAQALQIDGTAARRINEDAQALASAPLAGSAAPDAAAPAAAGAAPAVDDAALDADILQAAILNGALELLPESLSTLAIIPLQMKLVYRIGRAHGYALDSGHVKDFIATAGVGLTSQYLEQAGRKLLGKVLGGVLGGLGKQAVSSGMSFASTWALGHLAKRYYAGGRVLSTELLKQTYADLAGQAQALYGRHRPAIEQRARTLDAGQVLGLVRGA